VLPVDAARWLGDAVENRWWEDFVCAVAQVPPPLPKHEHSKIYDF